MKHVESKGEPAHEHSGEFEKNTTEARSNKPMTYRSDIDGLRAVAVLSIVLFHLGVTALSGGFVGVDIFFVISGFLITSLLVKEIESGCFSFSGFYMRRIRRLGPALVVTLIATLVAGVLLLSPEHLELLAESSIAALLSVSNILFFSEAGYFDAEAIYKPLLHTWSLGVEEQFYLIWPLLLLLGARLGRKGMGLVLSVLSITSLVASELLLETAPDAVFFLAPFRVFEFAFGAGLALLKPTGKLPDKSRTLGSLIGIVAILLCVFLFDKTTRFPGASALLPCLGTALIIWAGPSAWFNRQLSFSPIVFIGRISYSLYLVHWPVVVFYAYSYGMPQSPVTVFALTMFVIALASAMYFFVEQPFRHTRAGPSGVSFLIGNKALSTSGLLCSVVIFVAAIAIDQKDGLPERVPEEMTALSNAISKGKKARIAGIRQKTCHFKEIDINAFAASMSECLPANLDKVIVVYGDSHAADIYLALRRNLPKRNIVQLTGAGCAYGRGITESSSCFAFLRFAETWIAANSDQIDAVIYSQRAANLLIGEAEEKSASLAIKGTAAQEIRIGLETLEIEPAKVVFWGPRPEFHPKLEITLMSSRSIAQLATQYTAQDMAIYAELDSALSEAFESSGVNYLSSYNAICGPVCDFLLPDGEPIIVDYGHWAPEGGDEILNRMLADYPELENALQPKNRRTQLK